ncbi:BrnA antitoxin family protein [Steroidobacter cummioxidans]|uniref:BrnA antitoxin family protein n=1 Tax=Steroidobacter cummioxidans TaxID=1803913 RepID=UPI0019D45AAE
MKKRSSSKASKTDWKRVRAMKQKGISISGEHPEADMQHIVRGIVRRGLQPVSPKASIALRVDADVLAWFKAQGPGYQTRINAVLRAFKDASLQPTPISLVTPMKKRYDFSKSVKNPYLRKPKKQRRSSYVAH